MNPRFEKLFRQEAVRHHRAGSQSSGDVLRLSPRWSAWAAWILYLSLAAFVLYAAVGTVDEYAASPAIVRLDHRVDVQATSSGVVDDLMVTPGERVRLHQPLLRFEASAEVERLRSARRDFELQLAQMLRDPTGGDPLRRELRAARERAAAAQSDLEQRTVRATHEGVVGAVQVRPGQAVRPGDLLLSLAPPERRFSIVALMPGPVRPRIARGEVLRVALAGYRYASSEAIIDQIGDSVLGPAEVRRALGPATADSIAIAGPAVIVRAHLDDDQFVADGETLEYYDGMTATAQIRIARRSVLEMLVPWLRHMRSHGS